MKNPLSPFSVVSPMWPVQILPSRKIFIGRFILSTVESRANESTVGRFSGNLGVGN